jgi:hypothetical protein
MPFFRRLKSLSYAVSGQRAAAGVNGIDSRCKDQKKADPSSVSSTGPHTAAFKAKMLAPGFTQQAERRVAERLAKRLRYNQEYEPLPFRCNN